MGIMDWFTRSPETAPKTTPIDPFAKIEEKGVEVGGLNFKSAVDAHMTWKIRLEAYINGTSTEALKADVVCRDDQCPLGKWIYSRDDRCALDMLDEGEYARASDKVTAALVELFAQARR